MRITEEPGVNREDVSQANFVFELSFAFGEKKAFQRVKSSCFPVTIIRPVCKVKVSHEHGSNGHWGRSPVRGQKEKFISDFKLRISVPAF